MPLPCALPAVALQCSLVRAANPLRLFESLCFLSGMRVCAQPSERTLKQPILSSPYFLCLQNMGKQAHFIVIVASALIAAPIVHNMSRYYCTSMYLQKCPCLKICMHVLILLWIHLCKFIYVSHNSIVLIAHWMSQMSYWRVNYDGQYSPSRLPPRKCFAVVHCICM